MNKISAFLKALETVEYEFDNDPYWPLVFMNRNHKWFYVTVRLYNGVYFVSESINNLAPVEINEEDKSILQGNMSFGRQYSFEEWEEVLQLAAGYLKNVKRNWLQEYKQLCESFPYEYKTGKIHHAVISEYCPDLFSFNKELKPKLKQEFITKMESGDLSGYEQGVVSKMTASIYFDYCKIAYLNSNLKMDAKTKLLSGKEMYKLFADGRHEGLLDIKQNSAEEFRAWLNGTHPKRTKGGHPWEILRGGNTTKISLYVSPVNLNDGNGYTVEISGHSVTRLPETIKIFLGLIRNGCKVKINQAGQIRNRLLGQDTVGIVPQYQPLHRSEQLFDDAVSDTVHLSLCGRNKNKVIELASWGELPCLKSR